MKAGTRIAHRYVVGGPLGAGGLATALRVRDLLFDADVALKLVDLVPARDHTGSDDVLRHEFLALRAIHHPRVVRVHDFGYWRDPNDRVRAFYTSSIVDGVDLARFARDRTWTEIAVPVGDVLSALGSLHRRGVLHGDVHPGNVLVERSGRAVLIDLSCSRPLAKKTAREVSGTRGFIAPELLSGIVHRTADLYGLGMALRAIGVALPAKVARAVDRLVALRPEDRPQSAEEAAELLGVPWSRPPASDLLGSYLVGRDPALAQVRGVLEATLARASGPRVVTVHGDDGVGRTRLLEEVKTEAQLRMDAVLVRGDREGAVSKMLAMALGEAVDVTSTAAVLRAVERLAARREPLLLLVDDAHELPPVEHARLAVLSRSLPRDAATALVAASRSALRVTSDGIDIELAALDLLHLRSWLRTEVPERALREILRATGGYPKEVSALFTQLDAREWDSRALERAIEAASATRGRGLDLTGLDDDARVALAMVAAAGAIDVEPSAGLDILVARGLVVRDPDGVRLLRRTDAARMATLLGGDEMRRAHRKLADRARAALDSEPASEDLRARWIAHLAHVDPTQARVALTAAPDGSDVALRPAADAVVATGCLGDRDALLRCARIYVEAGEPARALRLVVQRMARRPPPEERIPLRQLAGQCYAQMGDSRRGVALLRRLLPHVQGHPQHAKVAAALSLALLKRGADAEAARVVRDALDSDAPIEEAVRLDLLLNAAFATSRSGSTPEARELLARAAPLAEHASPRGRFRLASATAFVEYGAGETAAAIRAYKEALDLAEQHGLDDLVASAALNYGTACHEQGDLGRALDAYGRGRRLAAALGMPTTEVTLSFDLAKVYADIGSHDRAALHAESARLAARRERMTLLEAGSCAILADVASAAGDHALAMRHLDEAEQLFASAGAGERDAVSLRLQRARAHLAAGEVDGATRALDSSAGMVRTLATRDAEAAWLGVRAAVAIAEGRSADATLDLERALGLAEGCGQRSLTAELEARMAEAFAASGSAFLAERHAARARELWEKTLAALPSELHDAFRRHPTRARTFALAAPAEAPSPRVEASTDLRRILEINRRLNSAMTTSAVLEETMDAAISLTGAERGFLLVRAEKNDALRVTVARNVDRETLRHGHLKFSRTVAERVVQTGEPVVAFDAAFDPRFAKARSVHAMRLKSLLCVPIRSPDGVLGAIYVDHRFSAGGFRPELAEILLALGDQAALAIVKARLVEELRVKTKELEERNAEIERLARGQALEIARLKQSLEDDDRKGTEAARTRFDYSGIVARSVPMRRVFSVLDRVIDADVTVLVRGESGTGKERIARAIHANSGRREGPFVAINCGALPESLLEAELFGYRRGAFSGATRDQPGLFVSARGGTLFLDELGEMAPAMQVKLLRVLQEREVRPLGSNEAIATDVRLVCATNRVLSEEVRAGRFREDLYYRVAVVEIELPPLRDRLEDVLPLAEAILSRLSSELGRPQATLDRSAERALLAHVWPGNVRELENALTKAFLLAKTSVLGAGDLELGATTQASSRSPSAALRARILTALEETDWNVVLASRVLGMPRATLYRKMRRFGLVRPPREADA